ncbi:unnamed protein product [Symbiodinium natans]|uniref:Uncharacterized protein n=1 Tax=Symbiodinium natans TaxID=878477 RepID=A0A812V3X1_9DINO|nr:unnamed protein product [Symbiodinium natans]
MAFYGQCSNYLPTCTKCCQERNDALAMQDYIFSQSIGTLNPPKFGKVLAAKKVRDSEEHLCVLYTVESSGPADRPPYMAAVDEESEAFEEVAYVSDYMSISRAPP